MAYDEGLAQRIREMLQDTPHVEEKKMFGGLTFMVKGNMCVGVLQSDLMVRIGPENFDTALQKEHTREMDFTGKSLKGFLFVSEEGLQEDSAMRDWVDLALGYIDTLPAK